MSKNTLCAALIAGILTASVSPGAFAADAHGNPAALAYYLKQVKPVLVENCFKCHGQERKLKGELRLTTRAGVLKGGENGPVINLKSLSKSRLLEMISYKDADGRVLQLLQAFLTQRVMDGLEAWIPTSGSPQGAVISSLLSNSYLDPLDHEMA